MGHLGHDPTLQLIRDRFYWPKIKDDVKHFASKVCSSVESTKPQIVPVAPVQSTSFSAPLELIELDFLHLKSCTGGHQYFLVFTDHFSHFAQVYGTTSKSTRL